MTLRQEMLHAARKARRLLGEEGWWGVGRFLSEAHVPGGGWQDRAGHADLYYTAFGMMAAEALGLRDRLCEPMEFLRSFGDGEGLDLVHLAALARCGGMAAVVCRHAPTSVEGAWRQTTAAMPPAEGILTRIEGFRCADGGFHHVQAGASGSAYGSFLAVGAFEDVAAGMSQSLGCHPQADFFPLGGVPGKGQTDFVGGSPSAAGHPQAKRRLEGGTLGTSFDGVLASVAALRREEGSFGNDRQGPASVTSTAAAATILTHLGRLVPLATADWLFSRHLSGGGFAAFAELPVSDLLSTATALHALGRMNAPLTGIAEACSRFVLGLRKEGGGFAGSEADPTPDVEYTFYALLALGRLAEAGPR